MSGIVESIALILELLVVLISLSNLFEKKLKFSIYTVALIVVYLFIFFEINAGAFPTYIAIMAYIAIVIYSMFRYKANVKVTLINCLLAFAITSALQLIFYIPVFYLHINLDNIIGFKNLIINTVSMLTVIFFDKKIKLKVISDFIQKRSWIIKCLFFAVVFYLFANIFYMQMNKNIENTNYIQIIFFVFLFFLVANEWQKAIAEAERKKTQLEMNKLYYDAYDELLTLVRERQHDMKNHISAILGMVYTIDNYDDLVRSQKEYCHDVMEKSKETKLLLSSGNPLVAGFLYRKIQEAKEKEIEVEYKVGASSPDFSIPEYEMVEILGVLLDNAIEALADTEEKTKKINVEIIDRKNELYITVGNTSRIYRQEEISKFGQKDFTSKGKGHGIGLSKLKKLVHGMDGEIIIVNNKREGANFLEFRIVIPKKKE